MRKILLLAAAVGAAATVSGVARAVEPGETPFPSPQVGDVFIAAQTVTPDGTMSNYFAPGSTVVFRAYAVDSKNKNHTVLKSGDAKYFYATIPDQKNVTFKYDPKNPAASEKLQWIATWTVPSTYPAGLVNFKVLVKDTNELGKHKGQFVQFPVTNAQLTISATPPPLFAPAPAAATSLVANTLNVSIYADTVAGSAPVGVSRRQVSCSQTNVFKRGEQLVVRSWGVDMGTGDVLSTANIDTATATVPGLSAPLTLNWGAHGATTNRVWFWSAPWVIPADYPLGDITVRIAYKTDEGKVGTYDHKVTVIPAT